jgi:hypothetical protein
MLLASLDGALICINGGLPATQPLRDDLDLVL